MAKLENKTKAQLIEIITRKDAVEQALRKDCEGTEKKVENLSKEVKDLKLALDREKSDKEDFETAYNGMLEDEKKSLSINKTLRNSLEDATRKLASLNDELKEVKQQRNAFIVCTFTCVVLVIINAML